MRALAFLSSPAEQCRQARLRLAVQSRQKAAEPLRLKPVLPALHLVPVLLALTRTPLHHPMQTLLRYWLTERYAWGLPEVAAKDGRFLASKAHARRRRMRQTEHWAGRQLRQCNSLRGREM